MRCPYCHAGLGPARGSVRCAGCGARHHRECFAEHGRCAVFACGHGAPPPAHRSAERLHTRDALKPEPWDLSSSTGASPGSAWTVAVLAGCVLALLIALLWSLPALLG